MESSIVQVDDGAGNMYELLTVDGITLPRYFSEDPVQKLVDVQNIPGKDDDVIIAAYPKAGTHWTWEITNMLLRGSVDYHQSMKEAQMMELADLTAITEVTSPRVFNTHLRFRQLPKDMLSRKCKILYVERNPKDMAVSRFCHNQKGTVGLKGSFDSYIRLYLDGKVAFGSWFDYTTEWTKDLRERTDYPICRVLYENLKRNPLTEMRRISEFLGFKYDDSFLEEVYNRCNFDNLKSSYEKNKTAFNKDKSDGKDIDPTQFAFRKGQVGDWKNWFTVANSDMFDEVMKRQMPDHPNDYIYE